MQGDSDPQDLGSETETPFPIGILKKDPILYGDLEWIRIICRLWLTVIFNPLLIVLQK